MSEFFGGLACGYGGLACGYGCLARGLAIASEKWYGFFKSGTAFSKVVRLFRKWYHFSAYQPYTAAGKAIPPLAKPNTARRKAVSHAHARARACVARDKFRNYLSPSPTRSGMPYTKAFRPAAPMNLPSSILHRTFTEPSPDGGEG